MVSRFYLLNYESFHIYWSLINYHRVVHLWMVMSMSDICFKKLWIDNFIIPTVMQASSLLWYIKIIIHWYNLETLVKFWESPTNPQTLSCCLYLDCDVHKLHLFRVDLNRQLCGHVKLCNHFSPCPCLIYESTYINYSLLIVHLSMLDSDIENIHTSVQVSMNSPLCV